MGNTARLFIRYHCLRVNIGYDLSKVARRMGDFATGELENAMNIESHNKAIAEAYYKYAKGQTLIFATSVQHAQDIAKEIPGAVAVTGDTKTDLKLSMHSPERNTGISELYDIHRGNGYSTCGDCYDCKTYTKQ